MNSKKKKRGRPPGSKNKESYDMKGTPEEKSKRKPRKPKVTANEIDYMIDNLSPESEEESLFSLMNSQRNRKKSYIVNEDILSVNGHISVIKKVGSSVFLLYENPRFSDHDISGYVFEAIVPWRIIPATHSFRKLPDISTIDYLIHLYSNATMAVETENENTK